MDKFSDLHLKKVLAAQESDSREVERICRELLGIATGGGNAAWMAEEAVSLPWP